MEKRKRALYLVSLFVFFSLVIIWTQTPVLAQGGRWQIQYDSEANDVLGLNGNTLQGSFATLKECETFRKSLPVYNQSHSKSVRSDVPEGPSLQKATKTAAASAPVPPSSNPAPILSSPEQSTSTDYSTTETSVEVNNTINTEGKEEISSNIQTGADQTNADIPLITDVDVPEIVVQVGHLKQVNSVAFTPNGQLALSGSRDATIKLWDVATGKELRSFKGNSEEISSVAISSDGRFAITGDFGYTNNVRLWDILTGKLIRRFKGLPDMITSVAISPDGQYVIASGGQMLKVWDISTGEEIHSLSGHNGYVHSIEVSRDGRYIISGSDDKMIKVWDLESGRNIRTFSGHTDAVTSLAISPDGKFVISGSFNDSPKMWDMNTGYLSKTFDCGGVLSLAISPDGANVIFGSYPDLQIWDISKGKKINSLKGDKEGWVRSISYSQDGKYILSGGDDRCIRLFDGNSGKEIWCSGGQAQQLSSVAISPDGGKLIVGMESGFLNIWDLSSGKQIKRIKHNLGVQSVAITSGGTKSFAGGWDFKENKTSIIGWETSTGQELVNLKSDGDQWVQSLALTNDGMNILWSAGTNLFLSDIVSGQKIKTFNNKQQIDEIRDLNLCGDYAITRDVRDLLQLWEIQTGESINSFPGYHGALSYDCKNVLLMRSDTENDRIIMKLLDIASNREISSVSVQYPLKIQIGQDAYRYRYIGLVAISPDNRLAIWSVDNEMHLWDIAEAKEIFLFSGHTNQVTSIGFSPNGKFVYTGSMDGSTRLWNIETGKEMVRLYSFNDGEWIIITPEGYFDASPEAGKYLSVREENFVHDINRVQFTFQSPALIQNALQGYESTYNQTVAEVLATSYDPSANHNIGIGLIEVILILLLIWIIPFFIALIDIVRKDFSGNNKIIWLITILLIPIIGTLLYFFIGRKQKIKYSRL